MRVIIMASMLYVVSGSSPARPIGRLGRCSPATGAGVHSQRSWQPCAHWEAGAQRQGRSRGCAASQPHDLPASTRRHAAGRAHLRALAARGAARDSLTTSIVRKRGLVSRWIAPGRTGSVYRTPPDNRTSRTALGHASDSYRTSDRTSDRTRAPASMARWRSSMASLDGSMANLDGSMAKSCVTIIRRHQASMARWLDGGLDGSMAASMARWRPRWLDARAL